MNRIDKKRLNAIIPRLSFDGDPGELCDALIASHIFARVDKDIILNENDNVDQIKMFVQIYKKRAKSLEPLRQALILYTAQRHIVDELERFSVNQFSNSLPNHKNPNVESQLNCLIKSLKEKYQRALCRVKPVPTVDEVKSHMDEIFVPLQMEDKSKRGSRPEEYHSCLIKALDHSSVVVCKGEPGSGKTTMMYKICYDWAMGRSDDFDLVLCCRLREAEPSDNILDMVLNRMEKRRFLCKRQVDIIRNIDQEQMTSEPRSSNSSERLHVLMILDGFDEAQPGLCPELSELLEYSDPAILPFAMLLTSRPGAVTADKVRCKPEFLQILGFNCAKQLKYIQNHFKGHKSQNQLTCAVVNKIKANDELQSLAKNPLTLCLICLVHDNLKPNTSLSELYEAVGAYLIARGKNKGYSISDYFENDWTKAPTVGKLAKMAFYGLMKDQIVFSSADLKLFDVDIICVKLGMLIQDESRDDLKITASDSYYYPHKSVQEFFAALYLFQQFIKMSAKQVSDTEFYEDTEIQQLRKSSRTGNLENMMMFLTQRNKGSKESQNVTSFCCRIILWVKFYDEILRLRLLDELGQNHFDWSLLALYNEQFSPKLLTYTHGATAVQEFVQLCQRSILKSTVKLTNAPVLWNPYFHFLYPGMIISSGLLEQFTIDSMMTVPDFPPDYGPWNVVVTTSAINSGHELLPEFSKCECLVVLVDEKVNPRALDKCSFPCKFEVARELHLIVGGSDSNFLDHLELAPLMSWLARETRSVKDLEIHTWNCSLSDLAETIQQEKWLNSLLKFHFGKKSSFASDAAAEKFANVLWQWQPTASDSGLCLYETSICGAHIIDFIKHIREKPIFLRLLCEPSLKYPSVLEQLAQVLIDSAFKNLLLENNNLSESELFSIYEAVSTMPNIETLSIYGNDTKSSDYYFTQLSQLKPHLSIIYDN